MTKIKRWQIFLIAFVTVLTVYNILPTVFYYTQPLHESIDTQKAATIQKQIFARIANIDKDTKSWIEKLCATLDIRTKLIKADPKIPAKLQIVFYKEKDADIFRDHFLEANSRITHTPERLVLREKDPAFPKEIFLERSFSSLSADSLPNHMSFSSKMEGKNPSDLYKKIILDRVSGITTAILQGANNSIKNVEKALHTKQADIKEPLLYAIAESIQKYSDIFGKDSSITKRHFQNFHSNKAEKKDVEQLTASLYFLHQSLEKQLKNDPSLQKENSFLQKNAKKKLLLLEKSLAIIKQKKQYFTPSTIPFSPREIDNLNPTDSRKISLKNAHPFIKEIEVCWEDDLLRFFLHEDVVSFFAQEEQSRFPSPSMSLLLEEIARISRLSSEHITKSDNCFEIRLSQLEDSRSILACDLWKVADEEIALLKDTLASWKPSHLELQNTVLSVIEDKAFAQDNLQHNFSLVVVHPKNCKKTFSFLKQPAIYVVFRGLGPLVQKYEKIPNSEEAQILFRDIRSLQNLLSTKGFIGYSAQELTTSTDFAGDFVFENRHYFRSFILATEENFQVFGSNRYAFLELKDWEQRMLTVNQIETTQHDRLLQERDYYRKASLYFQDQNKTLLKPKKNIFWNNMSLAFAKYFRGDERKILKWGLDLSGGKSVTLSLEDQTGQVVQDPKELDKTIVELEKRINRLGVAETAIRKEGSNLIVDFPGSQNLSAQELIQGSTMYFHIAHEKFSREYSPYKEAVTNFLQEVWNEALMTQKTDADDLQAIACRRLYGEELDINQPSPSSVAAKTLYDAGLRLGNKNDLIATSSFNEEIAKVVAYRQDLAKSLGKQHLPLCIVFYNHALEGKHLSAIQPGYDPTQGNFLRFSVKNDYETEEGKPIYPKDSLFSWTKEFAKQKVLGTAREKYTNGSGYRMCVLLNDAVISAPTLDAPIRDQAMISGNFSQKEVNSLASDLKAGSLSYKPKILSETNVSPELGIKERRQGIIAIIAALVFVIAFMSIYYGFAGVIASCAVLCNLLIIWACLQNIQAALTLPGIAGIILTMGMAVDANVLIFERIREELLGKKRLALAMHEGYKKAFTAIFDANITTIIAGVLLLNFATGPIKAFAITLIIGITASLFSGVFMTRIFFTWWVEKTRCTTLKMCHFIRGCAYNFLGYSRFVFATSAVLLVLGAGTILLQKSRVLGMEFTGGHAVELDFVRNDSFSYQDKLTEALLKEGVESKDFQIRSLGKNHRIRLFLSANFTNTQELLDPTFSDYKLTAHAPLTAIVAIAQKHKLPLEPTCLQKLHHGFTSISPQLSTHVKKQAIFAIFLAFIGIFIYLGMRFAYVYALSAVLCLVHDVLIAISCISLLRYCGIPLQIDLHAIAALMTIIGYSLNDTIIVFDRIREKKDAKHSLPQTINEAINDTFSRTMMTSLTTLISLLTLVFLGGSSVFNFAFIMTIGVIFGTVSSLFIAGPLLLLFGKTFPSLKSGIS